VRLDDGLPDGVAEMCGIELEDALRTGRKIGLSMRVMGLAGWSRPSVPTTERMRKLRATRRALTRTV